MKHLTTIIIALFAGLTLHAASLHGAASQNGEARGAQPQTQEATKKLESRYIFGFAFSFSKMALYMTDVAQVDSLEIGTRGMVMNRDLLSNQLRSYLIEQGVEAPTCMVFVGTTIKEINEYMEELMKAYAKEQVIWHIVTADRFKFTAPAIR